MPFYFLFRQHYFKNTFVSVLSSYKLTSEIPVVNCSFILTHHVNIFWLLLPFWHLQTLFTRLKYVDIGNKKKTPKRMWQPNIYPTTIMKKEILDNQSAVLCIYIYHIFIWKNDPFTTGATTTGVAVVASKICLHIKKTIYSTY